MTRRAVTSALLGGLAAAGSYRWGRTAVTSPGWLRTNHAGNPITLVEGPAAVAGLVASAAPHHAAGAVSALGAGAFGYLDDHHGDASRKGLAGHLRAARSGEITTGFLKIIGLGVTGVVAATLADRAAGRATPIDAALGGAVIAGSANVANLLDLRPGRSLKAAGLGALVLSLTSTDPARSSAAGVLGVSAALLPADLAGESMLGDTGANAVGAVLGTALVERLGRPGRVLALTVLAGLVLASERVSYSAVIEANPALRAIDQWGRP